jgi:hypothetical protein
VNERQLIRGRPGQPVLLVVVDTEEEFEWGRFDREATSVESIAGLPAFQSMCEEFGIVPCYVVDYPITWQPDAIRVLRPPVDAGRATLGAHLHPWVNPPHEEEVNARNSYPGNLPPELERRKILELAQAIERAYGLRPRVYKAGRYGLGPETFATLEAEGFEVDLSVYPRTDMGPDHGPDFRPFGAEPFWFGARRRLLGLPVSGEHVGWLSRAGDAVRRLARLPVVPGLLARIRALELLRLTPEGVAPHAHVRLTRALLARGVRVFTFSLHSPSLRPGYTPYVRDEGDLRGLLDACRAYFRFFLDELGGTATTPLALKAALELQE